MGHTGCVLFVPFCQVPQVMCKELGQEEMQRAEQGSLHCEDDEEVTAHGGSLAPWVQGC